MKEFVTHLKSKGTTSKFTVHDTPQQNGVAERRNRTIIECIQALLHVSGLPRTMWGEAARHVVWLMNRCSTKKQLVVKHHMKLRLERSRTFLMSGNGGDKVWVWIEGGDKLGGRVREGRWMGVSDESKGVHVYWPDKKTVSTERNVYFDKTSSSVSRLEGEEWELTETKPENAPELPTPKHSAVTQIKPEILSENDEPLSELEIPEIPVKRIRKPTVKLKDIIEGHAVISNLPAAPQFTVGTQLPSILDPPGDVLEVDESADWMMLMEDALMAQTSEMEALEPPSLAAAKKSPD